MTDPGFLYIRIDYLVFEKQGFTGSAYHCQEPVVSLGNITGGFTKGLDALWFEKICNVQHYL